MGVDPELGVLIKTNKSPLPRREKELPAGLVVLVVVVAWWSWWLWLRGGAGGCGCVVVLVVVVLVQGRAGNVDGASLGKSTFQGGKSGKGGTKTQKQRTKRN